MSVAECTKRCFPVFIHFEELVDRIHGRVPFVGGATGRDPLCLIRVGVHAHAVRGRQDASASGTDEQRGAAVVPPPLGARPHPNQTKTTRAHRGSVISQRLVCSLARCKDSERVSKAHEAARKARKDRPERARSVSVEGPDEPHSRSARNENWVEFSGRTSRLCPCAVMRGLRCVPRSGIRVASCIIPMSVLSFWRDAYGVAWHTGGVVRWIAALA